LKPPYADLGLVVPLGALGPAPTLPLWADAEGCLTVGLEMARDVDAAIPRATVLLTPFATGRVVVGAGSLREAGSAACSTSVFRSLEAGSGTEGISCLFESLAMGRGSLQPEGLCLAPVGGIIAPRAFTAESCISPRTRGGEDN
jgi:hypothetical protein